MWSQSSPISQVDTDFVGSPNLGPTLGSDPLKHQTWRLVHIPDLEADTMLVCQYEIVYGPNFMVDL